jgi:peptidoglycan/LPS O-acetylase OafA/YrhL
MTPAASFGYAPIVLDISGAGVDLFFVISGFVMVYASQDLFQSADGGWLFLRRRIARIVPLYWIVTTLFLLTMVLMPHALSSAAPTGMEILKSYFFIPYAQVGADVMRPIYKLGWTLEYEMFFYCVFAALLFLPMRWTILATAILFSGLATLGATLSPAPGILSFWTDPIILEFVMGAFIAMAFLHGWRLPLGVAAAVFLIGLCGFALASIFGIETHGAWRPAVRGLPAAMIVAAAVFKKEASASEQRITIFLVALGDASYAVYLLHPWLIRSSQLICDRMHLSSNLLPWIFVGAVLALLAPVSLLVHRRVERPMTKYVQRLFFSRRPAAVPLPALS